MSNRFKTLFFASLLVAVSLSGLAQQNNREQQILLKPDRVFDGESMHDGWQVLVAGSHIEAVGPNLPESKSTRVLLLKGCTLLPGFIEGHSHLFLHPYNETAWKDQVLNESRAERTARAVVHAGNTLMAGFTTVRDLGTEGAMYDDVGLRDAIEKGIVPGPRMLVATRAIVAKGSYAPKPGSADVQFPQGAAEAGNAEELVSEVRTEIGKGADLIKLYADYRWGIDGAAAPTFTEEELRRAVEVTASSGRWVAVHASTPEGMRRAAEAGVRTIEHGDYGTAEVFALMKKKGVALCPTLTAGTAMAEYAGWKKGIDPDPGPIMNKKKTFALALASGVTICFGGDVGVFTHGDNAREMELMVEYGMKPIDVLRAATSINADVFGLQDRVGRVKTGLCADLVVVEGDPLRRISDVRNLRVVMKGGQIYTEK